MYVCMYIHVHHTFNMYYLIEIEVE